jgi:YVTN family beta-propeller protein
MRISDCRKIVAGIGPLRLWLAATYGFLSAAGAAGQAGDYLGPCALVASPHAKTLYVACADARQVAWVELPRGEVARRVAMPAEPTDLLLTPDGTKLIVSCAAPQSTIVVLDAASGQVLTTIPAGHTAMGATLHPDGTLLYVCNRFDDDVSVIDWTVGKEVKRLAAVREPVAAAITPDGRTLLVANHLANMRTNVSILEEVAPVVTVVDARTYETTEIQLPSGSNSLRGLCVSPDGTRALVTHLLANFQEIPFRVSMGWINTNVVSILDTQQRKLLSTIGLDELDTGMSNPWDVAYTADGKSVCVTQAGTHNLSVIDSAVLLSDHARRTMQPLMGAWPIYVGLGTSLWQRVSLPGKGPRALAAVGSKIYVAEYFSDTLAEVDLQTPGDGSTRSIALGPAPQLTAQRRGELLFNDATICYQQWQSCASCHPDGRADALTWDLMNDGVGNPKNTKSMLLAHQTPPAMAEGVRSGAEEAVRSGLVNILFSDRLEEEAAAMDAYLKSLQAVPSPHLVDGRLSAAAQRGRTLFQSDRVGCHRCHPAPLYTDLKMHNVGTRRRQDRDPRLDTPTLVEVWRTAPYLHDGRYTTIQQLLVEGRHGLRHGGSDTLGAQEVDDLVEFVLSL